MGNPNQWMNTAQSGYGQTANIMNTGYQNQLQEYQAEQQASNDFWAGAGNLAGMAMGAGVAGGGTVFGNIFSAEGGAINADETFSGRTFDQDGEVVGPGGPKDDAVDARLSDGEYVVPYEVVHRKGTEFFDKLIEKTHGDMDARAKGGDPKSPRALQRTPHGAMALAHGGNVHGYAEGGAVPVDAAAGGMAPQAPAYQGMNSWQQHAGTPTHHQALPTAVPMAPGAPGASPAPALVPPQAAQAMGRTPAMQAILDKYSGGGAPRRQAVPSGNGRLDGEGLQAYFHRKYGIGTPPAPPAGTGFGQKILNTVAGVGDGGDPAFAYNNGYGYGSG
jgi:hypothetical protein